MQCSICADTILNNNNTILCKNKDCNLKSCVNCNKKYLIESGQDPHCLACRHETSVADFVTFFPKNWRLNAYKEHCKTIIWAKEQARLHETLDFIAKQKEIEAYRLVVAEAERQAAICRANLYHMSIGKTERVKNIYKYKCPTDDCNGSLNNKMECALCEFKFCKDCFEKISDEEIEDHVCNEEKKQTVTQIKKEARPCPTCGEMISKVDGCFAKNTEILMYDGSIKLAQDVVVGDKLIGDDGNMRIVQELCSGTDELYEVYQTKGVSYTVNSKHTLVVKYSGDKKIYWSNTDKSWKMKYFDHDLQVVICKSIKISDTITSEQARLELENYKKTILTSDEIEITVDKYLKLNKSTRYSLYGFKSNGANWDYQEVELDPYLLGVWLGDGTHSLPAIASNDIEIQEYILKWCDNNDAELVHQDKYIFKIRRRNLTNYKNNSRLPVGNDSCENCHGCSKKKADICDIKRPTCNKGKPTKISNPFIELLNKYNLFKNKHIPNEYLINSRKIRLQLLAGIIDTDGSVSKNNNQRVTINQTNPILSKQIIFLAKSLGFNVNVSIEKKNNIKFPGSEEVKNYKDQFRINISGSSLHEIPTILPRKKCYSTLVKDNLITSITVTNIGNGEYFGWKIDGNHRFVLNDYTTVRNCDQIFCVSCGTGFSWRTGIIEKGIIHNPHAAQYYANNPGARENYQNRIRGGGNGNPCDVTQYTLENHLRSIRINNDLKQKLSLCSRAIYNFRNYHRLPQDIDNHDIRLKWLQKDIDEKKAKTVLHQRHKKIQKQKMDYEVLNMFHTILNDLLRMVVETNNFAGINQLWEKDIFELVTYSNTQLYGIGNYFGLKALFIHIDNMSVI